MKINSIVILPLLLVNCAFVTIGKLEYIYETKAIRNSNNNNSFSLQFDLRHSTWEDKYFAKDTIPDSIYNLDPHERKDYYTKVKYRSVSRGIGCGYDQINNLSILDTSRIRIVGINYKNAKWGKYSLDFVCKDTGNIPFVVYATRDTLRTNLRIGKDTIFLDTVSRTKFQRKKTSYLLILLGRLF